MTRGLKVYSFITHYPHYYPTLHWLTRWQGDWKINRDYDSVSVGDFVLHWLTRWQGDWKIIKDGMENFLPGFVTLIDPMTRGLKVGMCMGWGSEWVVTLIDPMTRGLKALFLIRIISLYKSSYTDWPDDKGTERGDKAPWTYHDEDLLHWLTRWQGDWKGLIVTGIQEMLVFRYTDWPDDKGTERFYLDPGPFSPSFALHWLTRWQGDWKYFKELTGVNSKKLLHWLTRWQGDWKL